MQDILEEWKPVVGWESSYAVSNQGRVKRTAKGQGTSVGRFLSPRRISSGYFRVALRNPEKDRDALVHTLVTEAFLGPKPDHHEINHKDGVKSNNQVDNLEYVTSRDNKLHASITQLRHYKLTPEMVNLVRTRYREGKSFRQIGLEFGVHHGAISNVINGRTWCLVP